MTLTQTVTNILNKRVTDQEAKMFAFYNYGILATYIRGQLIDDIMKQRKEGEKTVGNYGSSKKSFK
jgi:hypothetical protein